MVAGEAENYLHIITLNGVSFCLVKSVRTNAVVKEYRPTFFWHVCRKHDIEILSLRKNIEKGEMRSGEYLFQCLFSRRRNASLTKAAAGLAVVVFVVVEASAPP